MKLAISVIVTFLIGIASLVGAAFLHDYWQSLLLNLGTGLLGLSAGLLIVNHLLAREDKKKAAIPMLRMIAPAVSVMHNQHFIAPGRLKFGMPGFHALIDAYQSNGRRPEALSPPQRDGLYDLIKEHRAQALPLLLTIHDQLKEMTSLLGWSFSPRIVTASLDARLDIIKFKNLVLDDTEACKLAACEAYLDIEAACGTVMSELGALLGKDLTEKRT